MIILSVGMGKQERIFTYQSNEPVEHKSGGAVMGSVVERRNAVMFPCGISVFEVDSPVGVQSSNGF